MIKSILSIDRKERSVTMLARCRAFPGEGVKEHVIRCLVTEDGEACGIKVRNSGGWFTTNHSLTPWHMYRIWAATSRAWLRYDKGGRWWILSLSAGT